ncbi:MAG: DUF4410 domain-containing protein [Thermodesulfovibrionales bacterium]
MKAAGWIRLLAVVFIACALFIGAATVSAEDERADAGRRVLGKEDILVREKLSKVYRTIVIRDISFEGTSIQDVDETKHPDFKDVVRKLGTSVPDTIASRLREMKVFPKVVRGADASGDGVVVLEARFTKITTGNRAARFLVGFGAGSSTVGIEGKLVDRKTGEVLATFENNTHSPASMGDYHVVLPADGTNNAKKIAEFVKKLY